MLGSCRHKPYEVLQMPNPFDQELLDRDQKEAYRQACAKFYPAIDESDFIIVYCPDGIGSHTQMDIDYVKKKGKPIIFIDEDTLVNSK